MAENDLAALRAETAAALFKAIKANATERASGQTLESLARAYAMVVEGMPKSGGRITNVSGG